MDRRTRVDDCLSKEGILSENKTDGVKRRGIGKKDCDSGDENPRDVVKGARGHVREAGCSHEKAAGRSHEKEDNRIRAKEAGRRTNSETGIDLGGGSVLGRVLWRDLVCPQGVECGLNIQETKGTDAKEEAGCGETVALVAKVALVTDQDGGGWGFSPVDVSWAPSRQRVGWDYGLSWSQTVESAPHLATDGCRQSCRVRRRVSEHVDGCHLIGQPCRRERRAGGMTAEAEVARLLGMVDHLQTCSGAEDRCCRNGDSREASRDGGLWIYRDGRVAGRLARRRRGQGSDGSQPQPQPQNRLGCQQQSQ